MLIDFHVHAFNPKIAERAISGLQAASGITPFTNGLIEDTVRRFDEWGVDKGVMLPIATKPSQQTIINNWAAVQESDRIIPFGSVHPDADDVLDELARIKQLGLHGVKLHPDYQGFIVDDPKLDPIYDRLKELDLPVIFHAGFDCYSPKLIHCPPERALALTQKHKGLKMIFAHLGGNDCWQQVAQLLAGAQGDVYLDTAFTQFCDNRLMEKIISRHGSERILFASDCPWESSATIADKIDSLHISDDAKEKIFSGNAVRLLGL